MLDKMLQTGHDSLHDSRVSPNKNIPAVERECF